jgi:hypothetical protein
MPKEEQIKALIRSHSEGDDARFYAIAMQLAAQAARSGRGNFAQEVRELIGRKGARATCNVALLYTLGKQPES